MEINGLSTVRTGKCDDDTRSEKRGALSRRRIPETTLGYSGIRQGWWSYVFKLVIVFDLRLVGIRNENVECMHTGEGE